MVELHSNYTFSGIIKVINGVYPSKHIFHETNEITHGLNEWFEKDLICLTLWVLKEEQAMLEPT